MNKKGWHWEVVQFSHEAEAKPVPIVHDAALANVETQGGRLIPLLFLDTTARPDVVALFEAHKVQPSGEVETTWAKSEKGDPRTVYLHMRFKRPAICTLILEFEIWRGGGLVDHIVTAQAVWLTPSTGDDSVLAALDRSKILAEVPSAGFREEWDRVLDSALQAGFRERGLSRPQARKSSKDFREQWRRLGRPFER